MHRAAFGMVWLMVMVIPIENMLVVPGFGTLGRVVGILSMLTSIAILILYKQKIRIHLLHWIMLNFVLLSALSYLWAIDPESTLKRVFTYTQILMMMWLVFQWCDTSERVRNLYRAFTLGGIILALGMIMQFQRAGTVTRFDTYNFNPNDIASILALTIPVAWYLFLKSRKSWFGHLCSLYPLLAGAGIILTGSRGGMIKGLLAVIFIILNPPRISRFAKLALFMFFGATAWGVLRWIPSATWDRLSTIATALSSGDLGGRTRIWEIGLEVFALHPFLGIGAGGFSASVSSFFTAGKSPHNVFLAILVEQGVIGFLAFAAVIFVTVMVILRLPGEERGFWLIMLLIWTASALTCNWEWRKQTWLLLVLAVAHAEAWRHSRSSVRETISTSRDVGTSCIFYPNNLVKYAHETLDEQ